jgi:hypothetical protein
VCSAGTTCVSGSAEDRTGYYAGLYRVRLVLYHEQAFPAPLHAREYHFTVVSR